MPLSEQRRRQLDEIVVKMANQNAPKEDVVAIVNDFKSKFENEGVSSVQPNNPLAPVMTQQKQVVLPPAQPPQQDKPGLLRRAAGAVGDVAVGFGKGVLDAPREFASLGADLGTKFGETGIGRKLGAGIRSTLGGTINPETARTLQAGLQGGTEQTNFTKPQNTAQKIGFGAEKIAEFFVPGGAAGKLGKAVSEAGVAAKLPRAGKFLGATTKAITEAGLAAGQTATQEGKLDDSALAAGGVSLALPIAGKVLKTGGKVASEVAQFMASKLSGVPKAAIEHTIQNPVAARGAIRQFSKDVGSPQTVLAHAEDALNTIKEVRRSAYKKNLGKVMSETMQNKNGQWYVKRLITPQDVRSGLAPKNAVGQNIFVPTNFSLKGVKDTVTKTLKDFGASAKGQSVVFEKVPLPNSFKKELGEVVNKIYKWDDISPTGLDDLREIIDVYKKTGANTAEKKFNKIVGDIRSNISKYVGDRVPQIREMNKQYAQQSDVIDGLMKELSVGKDKPTTALRKLLNVFNPKSEVYRPYVQQLGDEAGRDLMSEIAGLTMSKWTPEGIGAYVAGSGIGLGAVANPSVLLAAPFASPRIVGETAAFAGKVLPKIKKATNSNILPSAARGVASQILQNKKNK